MHQWKEKPPISKQRMHLATYLDLAASQGMIYHGSEMARTPSGFLDTWLFLEVHI